jgi:hypothetical protein
MDAKTRANTLVLDGLLVHVQAALGPDFKAALELVIKERADRAFELGCLHGK